MIIYVFNNSFLNKINLPTKISGVYQLHGINNLFLGNFEEENESWTFRPATNMNIEYQNNYNITPYSEIILNDPLNQEKYMIYSIPTYDQTTFKCLAQKDNITIGQDGGKDIIYKKNILDNGIISLTYTAQGWFLETNYPNVFVMGNRVTKTHLLDGDYLFFYGLKIIFYGKIMIINNPNNLVSINQGSLVSYQDNAVFELVESSVPEDTPLYTKDDYFFKSPRFDTIIEERTVKIDEPPSPENNEAAPLIATIGPQITMLCTSGISIAITIYTFTNNQNSESSGGAVRVILSVATMVITMIGAFLWPSIVRNMNTKKGIAKESKRKQKYNRYLEKKKQEIETIKLQQKQILIENALTSEKCLEAINQKNRLLWQRNIEHTDFLQIRLGTGRVETQIKVDIPEDKFTVEDTDKMYELLQGVVQQSLTIDNAPQCITLTEDYITAIVGNDDTVKMFLDNIFLQIMTLHSYAELKIIVYTKNEERWNYLKIIPHCFDNTKKIRYFATSVEELNDITPELEKIFDNRIKQEESEKEEDDGSKDDKLLYKEYRPYYLIFTDDISDIRNHSLIKKVLKYKQNVGFSILMANERLSSLPSETTSFVVVSKTESGLIRNELTKANQKTFIADFLHDIDIYECAKKVANIPIVVEKSKYELPNSLSFLEMYGVGKVEQLNINERWLKNDPTKSLSVPIGIDQNGEIFKMDIHENAYGPHGLIAGTTGSGKSEWIITYILSLAINYHPDELQFVLIDYKGGGLALSFENEQLGIKLPHLAGTITNLDKSEINRSIASMESELKRRQAVFNETRERLKEGSMNIYKYQEFYRKGLVKEPMSHLLIISDEFAELKQQQPEFMEQLISISRIGRSLGVHLILATQKPSGVVNDQIWSNSKFKVCLKVQDRGDSNEILKKPDAAFLKQTGAFYLEVGNDDYYNLGQSAWAGAKYYPSETMQKKVDQSVEYINNTGKVISSFDDERIRDMKKECKGEELINIIQYIDNASKKETLIKRQLWLPNIPKLSYLTNLLKKYPHEINNYQYNIAIGEYDEPRKQQQGLLEIDLAKGNVAIIGQVGSGKEMLLSTIIYSSLIEHTPQEINYYIIDMGAETLKKFSKFPHVGEVVTQSEQDKIIGVLELILDEQDKRKEEFIDYNGSF